MLDRLGGLTRVRDIAPGMMRRLAPPWDTESESAAHKWTTVWSLFILAMMTSFISLMSIHRVQTLQGRLQSLLSMEMLGDLWRTRPHPMLSKPGITEISPVPRFLTQSLNLA